MFVVPDYEGFIMRSYPWLIHASKTFRNKLQQAVASPEMLGSVSETIVDKVAS